MIPLVPTRDGDQPTITIELPPTSAGSGAVSNEIPPFTLVDQQGRTVTRETLLGSPWVANFIFARCPTHCPYTLREVFELQERTQGTDVKFVTVTVDPANDTVEKMAELSKAFAADPDRWLFLTGEAAEIRKLIMDGFKQPMESSPMALAHSLNLMHVDAEGKVIGQYRYHFQEPNAADELQVLRRVLEGKIETPVKNRFMASIPAGARAEGTVEDMPAAEAGDSGSVPQWVDRLRTTNAMLNGLATLLLLTGLAAIAAGSIRLHRRMMMTAFLVSVAFLASYLTYHGALKHFTGIGHKPYAGSKSLETAYRTILWSHIALAAVTPILAIITIVRGFRADRTQLPEDVAGHRRIARITFPIWLYVSITGVIIYFMNAA